MKPSSQNTIMLRVMRGARRIILLDQEQPHKCLSLMWYLFAQYDYTPGSPHDPTVVIKPMVR